uniref:Uncharacterized protein n=1 Tax=Arundo donax TaxID=35708 RepID=A0A0A9FXU4_ARUDO
MNKQPDEAAFVWCPRLAKLTGTRDLRLTNEECSIRCAGGENPRGQLFPDERVPHLGA